MNQHLVIILPMLWSLLCFGSDGLAQSASLTSEPSVRVLVSEAQKSVRVTVKGEYKIFILPSMTLAKKSSNLKGEALTPTPTGFRLGTQEWVGEGILIEAKEPRDLFLNKARFRGTLRILKNKNNSLDAVNYVNLEDYLYGVLHHEVAPWWPMQALKAQAVAARTYALYQKSVSTRAAYDLKSGTASQVYGGSTTERYRTKKAVDMTAGQFLVFDHKIFPAYFHATCAGITAGSKELWNIDLPPIAGGVLCQYCRLSPHYDWQAKIPLSNIEEILNRNKRPVGQILNLEVISQTPSHRVGSLKITGTSQEAVVAAKDFRIWIGGDKMRSTSFKIKVRDDVAEFQGKGWGHGVGLCQWGALGQALLGHSYQEILNFYYPKSVLTSAKKNV